MKHVFSVCSHLAFYLCHKLIGQDQINPDDCVFLLTRNYRIPPQYEGTYQHLISTSYNTSPTGGRVFAGWRIWQTRANIRQFDQTVDPHLQSEPFVYYTQTCHNDVCSLMVSKTNCTGYYVIEDGAGSYAESNPPTFRGIKGLVYKCLLRPFFPRIFCVKNHIIEDNHPKFKGCIATNDLCFPLHKDCRRVVGLPFTPTPLPEQPDAILSVDPLYLFLTPEQTEQVWKNVGDFINRKGYRHIAYKHHPYLLAETNRPYKEAYEHLMHRCLTARLTEIGSEMSLENILMAQPVDFYSAYSSVSIYAHAAGATCYAYLPLLQQFHPIQVPIIEKTCQLIR